VPKSHLPAAPSGVVLAAANRNGVPCPSCGKTGLVRIHRRLLDRLLSCVRPVFRFRCANPGCAWEGTLPQKWFASDRYRRRYLR